MSEARRKYARNLNYVYAMGVSSVKYDFSPVESEVHDICVQEDTSREITGLECAVSLGFPTALLLNGSHGPAWRRNLEMVTEEHYFSPCARFSCAIADLVCEVAIA